MRFTTVSTVNNLTSVKFNHKTVDKAVKRLDASLFVFFVMNISVNVSSDRFNLVEFLKLFFQSYKSKEPTDVITINEILCHEDNHLSQNCCYEVKLGYFLYIFLVGNTQHTNMFALKIAIIFAKRNSSRTMRHMWKRNLCRFSCYTPKGYQ